jgi:hypothetical protein
VAASRNKGAEEAGTDEENEEKVWCCKFGCCCWRCPVYAAGAGAGANAGDESEKAEKAVLGACGSGTLLLAPLA